MTDAFEVISMRAVDAGLRIDVEAGAGCIDTDSEHDTDFYIKPPLTEGERLTLVGRFGPQTQLGELLFAGIEESDEWPKLTTDGAPDLEHVDLGIELAKEIITLRGLRAGKVVAAVNGELQTHLVRSKSDGELVGEDVTFIDAEEFEEASRSPENKGFLDRAIAYGESFKNRNIRLVEATRETAVLRIPSGSLFGIGVGHEDGVEKIDVAPLE